MSEILIDKLLDVVEANDFAARPSEVRQTSLLG
jgi:hypothetical protein